MDKRPDFGKDLAVVSEEVTAGVDDVLQALRQKRAVRQRVVELKVGGDKPEREEHEIVAPSSDSSDAAPSQDRPRRPRTTARTRNASAQEDHVAIINVTTRLPRDTVELLEQASLRQKLQKFRPDTREGIHNEALQDWFRKHGYSA